MTNHKMTLTYRGLAVILGSLLVAVACSDEEDSTPLGGAGMGGDGSGGTSNAGSAGKSNNGGKGGSGGSSAGTNAMGGDAPMAGMGMGGDLGVAGEGGMPGMGGGTMDGGAAGTGTAGAAGSGEGGAGGAPVVQADTLDFGDFSGDWNAVVAAWPMTGATASATVQKWVWDSQPGVGFYSGTAYVVTMSQVVGPLPNGTYSFSMEVDRGALNEQYLFAKGCKANEPDAQMKEVTAEGRRVVTLANIEVSSGSCTVGLYTDAPDGGWANVDNATFVAQ